MSKPPVPDLRLATAVAAARLTSIGLRRARRGGTAAPGLVADRIDPGMLGKLSRQLPRGVALVAGTNGKTTVSRMLADILVADGADVVHNRSGSNLVRGVTASFAERTGPTGRVRGDVGVIEADEAAFPDLLRRIRPRVVLLNNLFRDQLDRYGELATIARHWEAALAELPSDAIVVANVDDPQIAQVVSGVRARLLPFGIQDRNRAIQLSALPHAADTIRSRRTGQPLVYDALYVGHLGAWRTEDGADRRPDLAFAGDHIRLNGVDSLAMYVEVAGPPAMTIPVEVGVPGLYNAYNALAATAAARALGVGSTTIQDALRAFRSAFGRIERVQVDGRTLTLALVKNPTGFNEVLRMLTMADGELGPPTMIAINDLDADGRDVSWLWDVDFELLAAGDTPLTTAGIRAPDMANRLKYAGVGTERITSISGDLPVALTAFIRSLPEGGSGYILPTYTAMLTIRAALAERGVVEAFWRQ